jgi:membrane associated rhomboid family serine protease
MLEDRYYMRQPEFVPHRSATVILLAINVAVFLLEAIIPPRMFPYGYLALSWVGISHGFVWQLLTYQFMHAGIIHLLLNGMGIYVFGRELELGLGVRRFLALYFLSGVLGGILQVAFGAVASNFMEYSWARQFAGATVGASAGVCGLVAAYAMFYPERTLTLLVFFVLPVSMQAKHLLLGSILLAVFGLLTPFLSDSMARSSVAHAAHLGGLIGGMAFVRYALDWGWRLPRFGGGKKSRLVRVKAGGYEQAPAEPQPPEDFLSQEVDPILDKISAHGIQSLTERERRILQAARDRMKGR